MRHGSALPVLETTVVTDWVDYNGHMNDAAYAIVFSRSVDALMDRVGLDAAARKRTGQTVFTLQMMLHYFKEAKEGDMLAVSCQLLEHDDKRMRLWLDMTAPSGELWSWGPEDAAQSVRGPAYDFCLLVTRRRHRAERAAMRMSLRPWPSSSRNASP